MKYVTLGTFEVNFYCDNFFLIFKNFIYLVELGLSCSMRDLHCILRSFLLWYMDSLVVAVGLL